MIYICGDLHGGVHNDAKKITTSGLRKQGIVMTEKDYLIVCGDFGYIWNGSKTDQYYLKWFASKPYTTLFVDGNHENFPLLNKYPIEEWNGGKVHVITENKKLLHLMRGQIFTIEEQTFFTFGGAESHDKEYRKEYIDWWREELPNKTEIDAALDNLTKVDYNVDYIISHAAPNWFFKKYFTSVLNVPDKNVLSKFFDYLEQYVSYGHWYCGHLHIDNTFKECTCLYNNVLALGEHYPVD